MTELAPDLITEGAPFPEDGIVGVLEHARHRTTWTVNEGDEREASAEHHRQRFPHARLVTFRGTARDLAAAWANDLRELAEHVFSLTHHIVTAWEP
ncbi:MAG: hypothetical protein QOK16_3325 [Solirubrobacteraceae bacterium]|nr:hypothetical protein [Solirubrobacteraceae bacterium]